jgi:hypothetical protein
MMNPSMSHTIARFGSLMQETAELEERIEDVALCILHLQNQIALSSPADVFLHQGSGRTYFNPLLHRLLRARPLDLEPDNKPNSVMILMEAVRLALILSLAPVRKAFGVHPITSNVAAGKLRALMERGVELFESMEMEELGLWVVAIGILESETEDKAWFVGEFGRMVEAGGMDFREVESALACMPWCDTLHGDRLRQMVLKPEWPLG